MLTLSNLKIGTKLALGFGAIAVLIVGLSAFSLFRLYGISAVVKTQNTLRTQKLERLYVAREALDQTGIAARNAFIFTSDQDARHELDILDKQKSIYLDALNTMSASFKGDADFEKAEAGLLAMARELERPRKFRETGKLEEFGQFLVNECSPLRRKIVADIETVIKSVQQDVGVQSGIAERELDNSVSVILAVATIALLASLTIGIVITRGLLRQLGGEPGKVADVARTVAMGDLTVDVSVKHGDKSSAMAAMKEMRDSLAVIVTQVTTATGNIANASTEIAAGNMDLSTRTEQQASSLQETASSMDELTSTVRQNTDNARQGNALAAAASDVAVKGGAVMSQVVGTMSAISESAQKINDIIGVIDGIAFQTNILALNAAVEAARAGEQGRGFAVVASEVRNLAHKSAAAAKEIKSLIGDSVGRIEIGSKLVSEAGTTMADIVGSVQRVTSIMGEILGASNEQSDGIEQVNRAISQMDQVTQQNAALVEQAAAAADALQEQARQLAEKVGVFKLEKHDMATASDASFPPVLRLRHAGQAA